ncbi:MAG: hypothetical protein VXZ73_00635 [Pseudomonadota bacterium]|nr:hypothetical protein [Pseudomonadota bacterium]MEC8977542.1 hypothetical protein [Pseudomonadota bacterium]
MILQLSLPSTLLEAAILVFMTFVFVSSGIGHFTNTKFFLSIMPPMIPYPLFWVYTSAVVELVLVPGLWIKGYRYPTGIALAVFLVAVFPANIYMAMYPDRFSQFSKTFLYMRLPIQVVLIYLCWWLAKTEL